MRILWFNFLIFSNFVLNCILRHLEEPGDYVIQNCRSPLRMRPLNVIDLSLTLPWGPAPKISLSGLVDL